MAVKAESFLVLEKSLSIRVGNAWDRAVSPVLAKIVKAVREKNFNLATDLVYQIDMRPVVEKQKKFIILVGMGAALYGAAKTTTPRDSTLFRKTVPPEVRQAADVLRDACRRGYQTGPHGGAKVDSGGGAVQYSGGIKGRRGAFYHRVSKAGKKGWPHYGGCGGGPAYVPACKLGLCSGGGCSRQRIL